MFVVAVSMASHACVPNRQLMRISSAPIACAESVAASNFS
jgi:hypothetical protein